MNFRKLVQPFLVYLALISAAVGQQSYLFRLPGSEAIKAESSPTPDKRARLVLY